MAAQKPNNHYTFQWGCGIKYSAYYMVPNAQKEYSEQQGVLRWG